MDQRLENEALVNAAYKAMSANDIEGLLSYLDADARFHYPEALSFGGIYAGHEQIRLSLKWAAETWVDANARLEQLTSWGDRVVAYLNVCGKSAATGKSFALPLAETWQVTNGRITERRSFFWDTHRLFECTAQ